MGYSCGLSLYLAKHLPPFPSQPLLDAWLCARASTGVDPNPEYDKTCTPSFLASPASDRLFDIFANPSASSRQGLSRQSNNRSPNSQLQERGHVPPPLPSPTLPQNRGSSASPVPRSPGLSSNMSLPDHASASGQQPPRRPPYFFRDEYSGLIVKGNFMTLAAKPVHVDDGEWLAHQGS